MADNHGPTPDEIRPARELIAQLLLPLARLAGLSAKESEMLRHLVLCELDNFVARAVEKNEPPELLQGSALAKLAGWERQSLDAKYAKWGPVLEICAVALGLLLDMRGDYLGKTIFVVEEATSPVGRQASGDGIHAALQVGKRDQRLFGLMLSGIDMHAHLTLAPTQPKITEATYAEQIIAALKLVGDASKLLDRQRLTEITKSDSRAETALLTSLGLTLEQLESYKSPTELLVPLLKVGRERDQPPEFRGLSPNISILRKYLAMDDRVVDRALVEIPDEPNKHPQRRLTPHEVRDVLGWSIRRVPLYMRPRSMGIHYAVEQRGKETLLYRSVRDDDMAIETMLAPNATFVLLGFTSEDGQLSNQDLAHAIAGAEITAARTKAHTSAELLGKKLAPSLTQATKGEARSFYRSMRLISHIALTLVFEQRKRDQDGQ